jgi:outer membrane protein assembly factor BamB
MNRNLLKSGAVIGLLIILIPPLGILLLWMKHDSRLLTKLAGSLAAIVFVVAHLVLFWNFHVEFDGGMKRPIFTFKNSNRHNEEIEKLRWAEHSIDASRIQAPAPDVVQTGEESGQMPKPQSPRTAPNNYWTDFRGPGRTGIYAETEIMTDWPSGRLPLLWKRPVGGGYASVVVADGTIFTIEQRRKREVVAAYDLDSGREKWIHGWDADFREVLGGNGPRATPVWHDGLIYALGATGELRCLDVHGKRIWSRNILLENREENIEWGMAATPLVVDDKVIVLPGGLGKSVVAYDRMTGNLIWKVLDDKQAYTAPQLATLAGRRQILVVSARRLMGLAVEDGALLWEYPWVTSQGISTAQPIVTAGNRLFISAAYDHGAALVEINRNGETFEARTIWANKNMKNKFSSSVLYEGYIYGFDEAILACIDAATGERKWKGGRYGYGQLLLASGHLVISSESGEVALVKANPEKYEEIARFSAIEGKTWNLPAIADGRLIVRNTIEMACFRITKSKRISFVLGAIGSASQMLGKRPLGAPASRRQRFKNQCRSYSSFMPARRRRSQQKPIQDWS